MSRRKVEINKKHVSYKELNRLYKETSDAKLKIKYLAMLKFWDNQTSLAVANDLRVSDSTVRDWLNKYNKFGLEGLLPQKHKGSECKLTAQQLEEVYRAVIRSPREYGFNKSNWSMRILKIWIDKIFGVTYAVSSLYDLVHRLGLSMQRPKKQCRNADPQKQLQFMDELQELVESTDETTIILYEDEAIITDEPTSTRKWAPIGQQPIIKTNSKGSRQRRVIFGAVSPENGDVLYSTNEAGNSQTFEDFLK